MIQEYLHGDAIHTVSLKKEGDMWIASIGDDTYKVDICSISEQAISLLIKDRSITACVARDTGKLHVSIQGESYCFTIPGSEETAYDVTGKAGGASNFMISAPMPGSVLKINVKEGEDVQDGQCLAIVEAMKMETGLHSNIHGRVKRVHATEGQQVNAGELLIELENT